jgi:hypothetical protein
MSKEIESEATDAGGVVGELYTWLQSPAFAEWLKGDSEAARQFNQTASTLVAGVKAIGAAVAPWVESGGLLRLARGIESANRWMAEAPKQLQAAFASEGLVPHPKALSLPGLRELTDLFERGGSRPAAERLLRIHEELIASVDFRREAQERWQQAGRWQVFSEVLAAYDAKLYSLVVPPALAQAEGIVAHLFGLKGMRFPLFKEKVAALHEEEFDLFGPLANKVLEGLLGEFHHGEPVAKLNRNAVMHGGDSNYGTRENAIAAIIWADYILCAANDYKAIAIPQLQHS